MDSRQTEAGRSRQNSAATTPAPNTVSRSPKPVKATIAAPMTSRSPVSSLRPHYTVFVRLPFPRNGFQDPPPVDWDASKDDALWKLISGSTGRQLNWEEISVEFEVSLPFLLQQAAWLYERRFESMKAQMKRLGASGTASPSTQALQGERGVAGDGGAGEVGMVRTGSRDSQKPTAINTQKIMPRPAGEMSSPGTPRTDRPMYSRTPSTTTVTQSRVFASSPRPPSQVLARNPDGTARPRQRTSRTFEPLRDQEDDLGLGHDGTSQSESEDEPPATSRSQAFRRAPISKKAPVEDIGSEGDIDDDDDDDSGGFLPFAATSKSSKNDPAATIRNSPSKQTAQPSQPLASKGKIKEPPPSSSTSSASSAQHPPSSSDNSNTYHGGPSNRQAPPLSPRHRAELEKLSPRYRRSGSEGSPSMGSSFSDLDDASVTQSALDDTILSTMQHQSMGMTLGAGMGSRIGQLRDALGRK